MSDSNSDSKTPWARWMPEPILKKPKVTAANTPKKPQKKPATPNLQTLINQVREQAEQQGYKEGLEKGHQEGLKQGKEKGLKQGYDEGLKKGYEEGLEKASKKIEQQAQTLDTLFNTSANALLTIETEMGQSLIDLAIHIAERVLHSTVNTHPEKLLELIKEVTRIDIDNTAALQIYLNPQDATLLKDLINGDPDTQFWQLVPDVSITPGGCKISTALGDIDATLETRWQRITSTLGKS